MSSQREPRRFAKGKLETRGRKPRKFDGMEPRQSPRKAWPQDKPPGGRLPPKEKTE